MYPGPSSITKHKAKLEQNQIKNLKNGLKKLKKVGAGMEVPPNALHNMELRNIFYNSIFKPKKKIDNEDNNYKFYKICIKKA